MYGMYGMHVCVYGRLVYYVGSTYVEKMLGSLMLPAGGYLADVPSAF